MAWWDRKNLHHYGAGRTRQRKDRCGKEPLIGSAISAPIRQAGIGRAFTVRIVARQVEVLTLLPPAVLATNHARARSRPSPALWRESFPRGLSMIIHSLSLMP